MRGTGEGGEMSADIVQIQQANRGRLEQGRRAVEKARERPAEPLPRNRAETASRPPIRAAVFPKRPDVGEERLFALPNGMNSGIEFVERSQSTLQPNELAPRIADFVKPIGKYESRPVVIGLFQDHAEKGVGHRF